MDKIFYLKCQRLYAIVLILVVVPLVVVGLFVSVILTYGDGMPDWLLIVVIMIALGISIFATLKLISKYNSVPSSITLNDWGIQITLEKRSLFFTRKVYSSAWTDIKAFSSTYSDQKNTRFYKVGLSDPLINIYIDDTEFVPDSETETMFSTYVLEKVNEHNRHVDTKAKIDTKNFYQSNWAKNLTYFVWVILAVLIVLGVFYSDVIEWWRIAQFAAFSGVWLVAYYANNRKKN